MNNKCLQNLRLIYIICISFFCATFAGAQTEKDALYVKEIYDFTLTNGSCYEWLSYLTTEIGGRLTGSDNAEKAVDYTHDLMVSLGLDAVNKQPCMVPKWTRGKKEVVKIINGPAGEIELKALALGNSIGTGEKGVTAEVIEVFSLDTLETMGKKHLKDKIVFFNRPMDPTQLRTFNAYGGAVDQRVFGATSSAPYGAKAVLVRSLTTLTDDNPHTGVNVYRDENPKIPALAISTMAADLLSELLTKQKVEIYIENHSKNHEAVPSYNVIGEIKGSEFPDEIILVGGHLDSWDVGGGAHDDGSGCVHSLQVFETLRAMNYKPKHTLRCVMFMNEENGLGGGLEYAKVSNDKQEYHLAAIESDSGGFTPRGFSCDAEADIFATFYRGLNEFLPILERYDLSLVKGGGGADINPLKSQKGLLIGFRPDSQRYFDYHHTAIDQIDAVNERELKLGAAAITSLVYLIDTYGLNRE
jgi:hypothetical protein